MSYKYDKIKTEGSIDEQGIRRYTSTWIVQTSANTDGPGQVASLVPTLMYSSWVHNTEVDLNARLKRKSATQIELGTWEVKCEYDSAPSDKNVSSSGGSPSGDPGQNNGQVQPDLRPWTLEIGTVKTTKLLKEDLNGVAVRASNGQPFDPPLEIPCHRPQITITVFKAMGADNYGNVATYTNSINSAAFLGFPAKRCLCTEYKLTSQFEWNAFWWNKTVTFEVYEEPLNPVKVMDAGTFERYSDMGGIKYVPILDPTGNPVTAPVPLDLNGKKLGAGLDPLFLQFKGYREVNWANII